jgi:beta-lactam-binding protein with PASTA domain
VTVPNVLGMTENDAQTTLLNAGLIVGTVTRQHSPTIPAGNVISQSAAAETSMPPGSAIDLVVSSGPTVPNVVGMTQSAAQTAITNAGLTIGSPVTQQYSSTVPAGQVISQTPAAGASVASGTVVNLTVSRGPQPVVSVPNVVGMTESAAQTTITAAGLTVGTVSQQYSTTVPAGDIISQNPAAEANVVPGTAVKMAVSKGPQPVSVPNVVSMTQSEAQTAITNAGLTVGNPVTLQYSSTVPTGQVISQTPAAGASVASGTAVNLTVSQGPQPSSGCFGGTTNNTSFGSPTDKNGDMAILLSASAALFVVGSRRQRRLSLQ